MIMEVYVKGMPRSQIPQRQSSKSLNKLHKYIYTAESIKLKILIFKINASYTLHVRKSFTECPS